MILRAPALGQYSISSQVDPHSKNQLLITIIIIIIMNKITSDLNKTLDNGPS